MFKTCLIFLDEHFCLEGGDEQSKALTVKFPGLTNCRRQLNTQDQMLSTTFLVHNSFLSTTFYDHFVINDCFETQL